MSLLAILTYLAVILYIVLMISRALRIKNMPVHLRWELYPVPHEKGRAHYGGSRLEEVDWWKKEHPKDHINEMKEMGAEILGLKAVWEHNRVLWLGTFPFHFGLYLLMGNMFILIVAALFLNISEISPESSGINAIAYYLIYYIALVSAALGALGSLRLMFSRMVDTGLRLHSAPSHYFNIALIGVIFATLLVWVLFDPAFVANINGYYSGLLSFSEIPALPAIAYWHIGITLFFIAYLPFTHMTHMILKYFSYHDVRWEDESNTPGSKKAQKLGEQLGYSPTWSSKHIGADGKKSWGDVVSDLPEDM